MRATKGQLASLVQLLSDVAVAERLRCNIGELVRNVAHQLYAMYQDGWDVGLEASREVIRDAMILRANIGSLQHPIGDACPDAMANAWVSWVAGLEAGGRDMELTGKINKKNPPRKSMMAAFDEAVRNAVMLGDAEAIERLLRIAEDQALVALAMGGD